MQDEIFLISHACTTMMMFNQFTKPWFQDVISAKVSCIEFKLQRKLIIDLYHTIWSSNWNPEISSSN